MGKPINQDVVLDHWGDVLRLTASIKTVSVKPSAMLRKLGAYRQQNRLYLALGEIGRIERTLFMLDWMESPQLRMECQAGLNKGEARHALARAVFAHSQGRVHDRSRRSADARPDRPGPAPSAASTANAPEPEINNLALAEGLT
jgi:TnpA family transposase